MGTQLPQTLENADHIVVERIEPESDATFPVVGVGASAGGLEAFTQLLTALPADTGMAFVLVQHLAPSHPSALAEILSRATKMPVVEVREEPTVEPNHIYVIPPDRNILIVRGVLQLLPREDHGANHPIDLFFRALAADRKHQAIGVVLSGNATDGTVGLEAIKAEGGVTFAQDVTAQYEGMPRSAIASGFVDFVLSPDRIAQELARIAQHPYAVPAAEVGEMDCRPDFDQVVQLLHHSMGVDFTGYKFSTLYRRIMRRMVFQKLDSLSEYVGYLRETPAELESLYSDILIGVTRFFRDKESFEALKAQVFPRLIQDRSKHDPVRIWTLGCSTGQEAYSLAMAFTEVAEAAGSLVPIQLFASDLNAAGIAKARVGLYPKNIEQDVSPERLRRFFSEDNASYRISKPIRERCIFAQHNVLVDPPFSRMDLISCRNLLIYLEPELQKKIMPTLHYALKPAGCLWLGGSETIGNYKDLFDAQDTKHKIYVKKPSSRPRKSHFPLQPGPQQNGIPLRSAFISGVARPIDGADLPREADRVLSAKFAPPSVLVSGDLDILQIRGDTSAYLAPAPGKASLNLMKMLREGLFVPVREAVLRAGNEQATVRQESLYFRSHDGYREVAIEVIPVKGNAANENGFLILFVERGSAGTVPATPQAAKLPAADSNSDSDSDADTVRLQQELVATREYLQSVIEQQEAANEELQSANEEVQSANEELQSTNEELETSKEEIQSSNEELATVNDELNNRNQESNRLSDDLINLIGSVHMPIVMLGPDLRIRRFTPAAEKLLNLVPGDVGRPLADIKPNLDNLSDLKSLLTEVLDTFSVKDREVRDKEGRWYSLRLRPYKTLDNRLDGVVMVLVDVNALKIAHAELAEVDRRKDDFLAMLAHELRNPLAPIRNAAHCLQLSECTWETVRSASAMIERQVSQMVRLVDDLLDVSRINQGKIKLRRCRIELASHVHHAVEAISLMYKSKGHELTVTLPPKPIYLNADPTRLNQVLGNLLNNACKFTDNGGRIWLTVEEEDVRAVIRIKDNGIGLSADQLPRIFNMFTQVDTSLERAVSGLGIGLTLVKSLVEMHEGTVEVVSAGLGQGSEFVVRMPIMTLTPESQLVAAPDVLPTQTGRRILVVDDNRDSAVSLAMLLNCTGHETQTAYDGMQALDAAAKFKPDVVLLDIGLPILNGYEVARKIREQPWGQSMVLVALTGWGQESDRRKSKEAGFNAHLVKPVEQSVLKKLLAELS